VYEACPLVSLLALGACRITTCYPCSRARGTGPSFQATQFPWTGAGRYRDL